MKLLLTILLLIGGSEYTGSVSEFNKAKREAEFAYNNEDYSTAVDKYRFLIDSLRYEDDNATLNLAHSHYKMNEIDQAKAIYNQLSASSDPEVNSIANQQLGVFESRGQNLQKALDYFKKSLIANPDNEDARYNYELVKKKLDEQEEQNQENQEEQEDQENKEEEQKDQDKQDKKEEQKQDQQKQDQKEEQQEQNQDQQQDQDQDQEKEKENEEKQQKDGEEKEEEEQKQQPKPSEPNFDEKEISKEMAEMILQAMRNKELQYLQQMKRKPTKPADKDKPDW